VVIVIYQKVIVYGKKMKYNININQLVLSKTQLDLTDCAILDYLYIYCNSQNRKLKNKELEKMARYGLGLIIKHF